MNIGYVEINYASDAASFGGASCGTTMHADVIEIEASSEIEACNKALEQFKSWDSHGMCSIRACKFLRWINVKDIIS